MSGGLYARLFEMQASSCRTFTGHRAAPLAFSVFAFWELAFRRHSPAIKAGSSDTYLPRGSPRNPGNLRLSLFSTLSRIPSDRCLNGFGRGGAI